MRARMIILVAAVALSSAPVAAQTAADPPVIVDPAGDANNLFLLVEGPDTRPASDDRLDILEIWPETGYDVVHDTVGGDVVAARHIARTLRINVRTLAPAIPSTGPTARFEVPVQAGECFIHFEFNAHGPLSGIFDPAQEPLIADTPPEGVSTGGGCLGSVIRSPSFTLATEGNVTTMEFPLDTLAGTAAGQILAPGKTLEAGGNPHSIRVSRLGPEPFFATLALGLAVDFAQELPSPYVIGSDVPPDIDCRQAADEPACAE